MFAKLAAVSTALMLLPAALGGTIQARADTPNFHLVSTSSDSNYHLESLKLDSYETSLTSGNVGTFYLEGGHLRVADPVNPYISAFINSVMSPTGQCSATGALHTVGTSSSNKCARYSPFTLSSYDQNAQLGAKLVFNNAGGFYACNGGKVSYELAAPSGCAAITLWTVPATV